MLTRDHAFVLTAKPYQEGHLMLALLTERHGLIRAVARRAQQTVSPLRSACQPVVEADFLLRLSDNGLADVLQAEVIDAHARVRGDLARAGFAAACTEWLMQTGGRTGLTHPHIAYPCYQTSLRALAADREPPALVYLRFLARTLPEAGLVFDAKEIALWSLSEGARRLLHGVVAESDSVAAAPDVIHEALSVVGGWIFDQTGIVLKSLKIAIQLTQ